MKRAKWWLIGGAAASVMTLLIGFGWQRFTASAQQLSEADARAVIMQRYPGELVSMMKSGGDYHIDMMLETGIYRITIDAMNGEVKSIMRQQQQEEPPETSPDHLPPDSSDPSDEHDKQPIPSDPGLPSADDGSPGHGIADRPVGPESGESGAEDRVYVITEREAVRIAEEYLNGEADDVKLYQPEGQTPYYLVEVERDEDDVEAIIQINAITKAIISVTWDDDDDDD